MSEFVDFLQSDRSWQDEIIDRLASRLDQHLVPQQLRRQRSRDPVCDALAKAAKELLTAEDDCRRIIVEAVARDGSAVEWILAKEIVERVPMPLFEPAREIARALHLMGILLCALAGVNLMICPCAQALSEAYHREAVQRIVAASLREVGV